MNILIKEPKDVIPCPACGKEFIYAYEDARGHASMPCVRCSRIILVDYENTTARIIPPTRRGNKKMK
ncbi:MAG: hypothetical protein SCK57_10435 [Bacillota bacterium]|nr:hypothetical protein [Bacillota bacterium]MDW7678066.1 hypothetical protein [Bacillota bacterium]